MENNEIYIDGINVAGCEFYEPKAQVMTCHEESITKRCDKTNCYYKQLKRLEQENEELKAEKDFWCNKSGEFEDFLDKLVAEEYKRALEEILESAKFAQCLPCGSGNLEDCLNCSDETTNNGQFCMEKRIHEIKTKCVEVLNYENNIVTQKKL